MTNILVIGSNSFIGKHFINYLSGMKEISLTVFGRSCPPEFSNLRFVQGDFINLNILNNALDGQDLVYHFISQTIPATSWEKPQIEIEKNLVPFLNFIDLVVKARAKKICFVSSGGTVYGLQQDILTEESLTEPFSPYGIIKRTSESFLQYAKQKHQLNYDIYRMSNVYGEGQDIGKGLGFINTALEKIAHHQPVIIYGDGENVRDYLYVRDAAKLLTLSLEKNIENSEIYNLSSNHPISLNELVKLMKNVLKVEVKVEYLSARASDNRKVVLDNTKLMKHFGQVSLTSLEDGIKQTYNYLKNKASYVQKSL
ncbi:MAG: NAD-dependent epimerase/dehydratase family protein [Pyrinomonadaceae bacterium]